MPWANDDERGWAADCNGVTHADDYLRNYNELCNVELHWESRGRTKLRTVKRVPQGMICIGVQKRRNMNKQQKRKKEKVSIHS